MPGPGLVAIDLLISFRRQSLNSFTIHWCFIVGDVSSTVLLGEKTLFVASDSQMVYKQNSNTNEKKTGS
jgi:hypothetical protein